MPRVTLHGSTPPVTPRPDPALVAEESVAGAQVEVEAAVPVAAAEGAVAADLAVAAAAVAKERVVNTREGRPYRRPFAEAR